MKIADYTWKEILSVLNICLIVTLVAIPLPIAYYCCFDVDNYLWHAAVELILSIGAVAVSVWFLGLTKNMKQMMLATVASRLHIKK